jgi:hypothetical protein
MNYCNILLAYFHGCDITQYRSSGGAKALATWSLKSEILCDSYFIYFFALPRTDYEGPKGE